MCFFVIAQHDRLFWQIQIQTDDIADLFRKTGIATYLEFANQVRFETMRLPDPADRFAAYTDGL